MKLERKYTCAIMYAHSLKKKKKKKKKKWMSFLNQIKSKSISTFEIKFGVSTHAVQI